MSHRTSTRSAVSARMTLAVLALATLAPAAAWAQTATAIAGTDYTQSSVIFDSSGNLYGTTNLGGTSLNCNLGCGTVFQLSPASGGWNMTTLYSFNGIPANGDGAWPTAGLVIDPKGRLFGTTSAGGSSQGYGTVFMLSPTSSGWKETVIHRFSGSDGKVANSGLLLDSKGNLYGTTTVGGTYGLGTVYMLSPGSTGWKETLLHSFGNGDGGYPGGIIFDSAGNIYGTTILAGDGSNTCGAVYQLVRTSGGWKGTSLHAFTGKNADGCQPRPFLAFDAAGHLYGTTAGGGAYNQGVVFALSHTSSGWKESTLYQFTGGNDGGYPEAIAVSPAGKLFGITNFGIPNGCNSFDGCSQVFQLAHGSGGWSVSAVYPLPKLWPSAGGLTFDGSGNLFGTVTDFHYQEEGAVFELTP